MPFNKNDRMPVFSGLWFDSKFIFRIMRKWIFAILCFAIVCSTAGYLLISMTQSDAYYASATVSVIPRNNADSYMNDNSLGAAITRNTDMWNSDMLIDAVQKANPDKKIKGTLISTVVEDSNLVKLTSTADTAENAYFLLHAALTNYKSVAENFDTDYYNFVLTNVNTASNPVTQRRAINYSIVGFLCAFVLSIFIILCWSVSTDIIHNEEQAENVLDMPVYGSLLHIRKSKKLKGILLDSGKLPMDYLEELDYITSCVEQHMTNRGQKVILVTSAYENEGKTTAAANLALNLSCRGRKTLLIDMDLRRPSIYKIFEQEKNSSRNLSDYLTTGRLMSDVMDTLRSEYWNLNVIWQFTSFNDADSLMEKSLPSEELNRLRDSYDYIVIDTSPVMQVRDTDIIARFADCSLFVIRQDSCRASVLNDMSDHMEENGAPCIGAILNNCQRRNKKRKSRNEYYNSTRNRKRGLR